MKTILVVIASLVLVLIGESFCSLRVSLLNIPSLIALVCFMFAGFILNPAFKFGYKR